MSGYDPDYQSLILEGVWESELPTETGWYWFWMGNGDPIVPIIANVTRFAGELVVRFQTDRWYLREVKPEWNWKWIGPLPIPNPPT